MPNPILQLEDKIDPKVLYNKSIKAKPKTKLYSKVRLLLIIGLIFVSIILSSLIVGLNFLEINSPNFDKESFGKSGNLIIEPNVTIKDIFDSNLVIPTKKQIATTTPYIVFLFQGFVNTVVEIISLIFNYSLEFILIGVFLLITCYWVYRITDWPMTNNKFLLSTIIIILTLVIGLGFLAIFKEDRRIPRIIRETRDDIREKLYFIP